MDLLDTLFAFAAVYILATGAMYLIRKEVTIKQRNPPQTIRYTGYAAFYLGGAHIIGGIFLAASIIPQLVGLMFVGIIIIFGGYFLVSRRFEKEVIEEPTKS